MLRAVTLSNLIAIRIKSKFGRLSNLCGATVAGTGAACGITYLLGGGYSLQQDAHVRMDLIYARWRPRKQAFVDSLTAFFIVFYLGVLLLGGLSSTHPFKRRRQ